MSEDNAYYLSYLLRLWRDSDTENVWRVSLESPDTGQRTGFASLAACSPFSDSRRPSRQRSSCQKT